jgi:hypothetical protein
MSEYIEFAVTDHERLKALQSFFNKLKTDKDEENIGDDEQYLSLIDDSTRKCFRWSTPEENALWAEKCFSTSVETRFTDPLLKRGWDFGSMMDAFESGEYSMMEAALHIRH